MKTLPQSIQWRPFFEDPRTPRTVQLHSPLHRSWSPFKGEFYIVSPTFPETFKSFGARGFPLLNHHSAMKSSVIGCTQIHFDKRNHPSTNLGGATPPENHYRTQIYGGVKDDVPFQLGDVNLPSLISRGVRPTSSENEWIKGD